MNDKYHEVWDNYHGIVDQYGGIGDYYHRIVDHYLGIEYQYHGILHRLTDLQLKSKSQIEGPLGIVKIGKEKDKKLFLKTRVLTG